MAKDIDAQQVRSGGPVDERVITYYDIPKDYGCAYKVVGLRALNAVEEQDASRSAAADLLKAQYEAVKRMIVRLDNKKVSVSDGAVDEFFDHCDPRLRQLLTTVYIRSSSPTKKEADSFFKSARATA